MCIRDSLSHEFIILAETGESGVYFHKDWLQANLLADIDYAVDLQPFVDKFTALYACADEKHNPQDCPVPDGDLMTMRGIEIGHIFYFGTKYSAAMGATVSGPDGQNMPVHMGSYGIGVSRLVGGIIEASQDDKGIVWPTTELSPYHLHIIPLNYDKSELVKTNADLIYKKALIRGLEVLIDDRKERPGVKFADADLIGIPHRIVLGEKSLQKGVVEYSTRKELEPQELPIEDALSKVYLSDNQES